MSGTSDEDPPDDLPSDPPPPGSPASVKESAKERMRSRLESVIPEILKRAVEIGVEKARESPADVKQFIHDLKVPKEVAHYLFQQIDDTKNGLFRVVAKEIRDFLEHTNFSGEVQKLLTTVQFEVNTTIRFTPNDGREPKKNNDGAAGDGGPDSDAKDTKEGKDAKDAKDASDGDDGERTPDGRRPLPRPEVKTSVSVRRDGRDRA
ncbi:MAG: putative protease [Myxococcaceae bacterium]|jgi:hypothetical protein|nr:putative protease [Myxococcaceae bacterium]MEA2747637.1 hypothetical protein [Myxococcales bacterium]